MAGLVGPAGGGEEHILETKIEKSLREMVNPLKNLQAAILGFFRAQGYQ
jgi:hypothetical protein